MKLLSGSSNPRLARKISKALGSELLEVELSRFANGEVRVWIKEAVRGSEVVVVQSFGPLTPDNFLVEFGLLVDAVKRAGATRVQAVVPWLGYAVQDKVFREGEPLSAKLIAKWIEASGVDELVSLDMHSENIVGFFNLPVVHLSADKVFGRVLRRDNKVAEMVVVAPDFGAVKRSNRFAQTLGVETQAVIEKFRSLETGQVEIRGISGAEPAGRVCVVFDDFVSTGGTLVATAKLLKAKGAKRVVVAVTHGVGLADNRVRRRLRASAIDKLYTTDSVKLPNELDGGIEVVSVAKLLAGSLGG